MTAIVEDEDLERRLRRYRKRIGADRYDEVWDGVYVMAAMPNNEHQDLVGDLVAILKPAIQYAGRGRVFPGVNVSDQPRRWKKNYRCPDVAVYLTGNPAEDRRTHWYGGPDLAVEIVSPGDRSRMKLDFYAKVGTREVLIFDRDPWRLELFRLVGGEMVSAGVSTAESDEAVRTASVPFHWRIIRAPGEPELELVCTESGERWVV